MKAFILLTMLAALVLLAGCTPMPSLNAIYTNDTIVFEPELIGTWREADPDSIEFSFERYPVRNTYSDEDQQHLVTNQYLITATTSNGNITQCTGTLCRIGDSYWLDLYNDDYEETTGVLTSFTSIRVHGFCRLDSIEPTLKFSNLSVMGLITYVEENPDSIDHEWYGEEDLESVLLTGSTEELQQFLLEIEDISEAFGELVELERVVVDD